MPNPSKEISAYNITILRSQSRLTQTEFGELFHSNQKAIWTYEKGSTFPGQAFTLALSKAYGFDPEALTTIKFKLDRSGTITNIPKSRNELQEIKHELTSIITETEAQHKIITGRLKKLREHLQMLESKGVVGLTKKLTTGNKKVKY